MGANLLSCNYEDEEFIDMEVSSSTLPNSTSKGKEFEFEYEFEFQMATDSIDSISNSPADELFHKGKLLPLLQNTKFKEIEEHQEEFITFSTKMAQSCNVSPPESCRVSTELTPDESFFDWSTELTGFIHDNPKKCCGPWSKKLKLIKQSSITQKLKASRSFLKSWFYKSACGSDGNPCANQEIQQDSYDNFLKKYLKLSKRSGFGQIETRKYPTLGNGLKGIEENESESVLFSNCSHRKSFSGAIKRKCPHFSTASFGDSNGIFEMLKRNSSVDSEVEGAIEAAIDHCKKSQQVFNSRNHVFFPKCTL